MSKGGLVAGPNGETSVPCTVSYIREVEPGLSVVSINGGRPEYLISRDWIERNPNKVPQGEPPEAYHPEP